MRVSSPRHPQIRTCRVVFNVKAATAIGERICVSGNHPLLGAWEERDALELVTTPEYYPTWYSLDPVNLPLGETVTYKYFIKSGGHFSRWESEEGDRTLIPRGRDMVVNEEIKTSVEFNSSASQTSTAPSNSFPNNSSASQINTTPSLAHSQPNTTKGASATRNNSSEQYPVISPNFSPPRPPSPVRSSPNLSTLSPRTNHSTGSDASDFEELQLDGRDAVIIASVFLPIRVRRGGTPIVSSLLTEEINGTNATNEANETKQRRTGKESSPPDATWHIEWDDSALLSRPALFSRKLHVDQDDHKMSYVGLIPMDDADLTVEEQEDLRRQLQPFRCTPIFLKKEQRLLFYEGFCHKALYKLVHNWVDIYGQRTTRWWDEVEHVNQYQSYLAVNAIFAQAIVEEYSEGDMIWVNGHELCLVSSYVLRKATTATIGMFVHSPFPSSEIFRTLSVREDILRGMLNCDQVGFHSFEYARHFLTCCRRVLSLQDHTERKGFSVVRYQGRDVRITVAHANIESRLGIILKVLLSYFYLPLFLINSYILFFFFFFFLIFL
jgi:trehalose 6-phosphate synthase/phosphatase